VFRAVVFQKTENMHLLSLHTNKPRKIIVYDYTTMRRIDMCVSRNCDPLPSPSPMLCPSCSEYLLLCRPLRYVASGKFAFPLLNVLFASFMIIILGGIPAFAQTVSAPTPSANPVSPVPNPCPRFQQGGVVTNPPALYSQNGVLNVSFSYQQASDSAGRELFCFMTPEGLEEPTLHVNPGDTLNITVTNNTPASPVEEPFDPPNCGDTSMTGSSVNIHYHGTNTSPACGADNVTKTLINSGTTFQYSVTFPANEPPGLYWYHPHVHKLSEAAVYGGAAGALIVDGIQNVQPAVSGLQEQILVIRDQLTAQQLPETSPQVNSAVETPNRDLTVNYVPGNALTNTTTGVTTFTPSVINMQPGEPQFWRICNCTSDTILDLQELFDGTPQTFQIVSIDGVPVNSQDGTAPGTLISATHYRMPPASRVEIIVNPPSSSVHLAQLVTQYINTGALGDEDPNRPLSTIRLVDNDSQQFDNALPVSTEVNTSQQLFAGLSNLPINTTRTLYFSENCPPTDSACSPTMFFITVLGQTPQVFDNNNPPSIITTQGAVEQWTVENQAGENHEFHFHQIHFLVQSQNNFEANGSSPAPAITGQFADMIEVPFWNGSTNTPFPSVTMLMDFRGMDIGDFVYHCHILGHEDLGMMAIIQVLPPQ
jgi:FtsP/CotA-like multicopper oxidase with cupredoxin domain